MSDDTEGAPQSDDETQAGFTQAAYAGPVAWSDATHSQPVVDYSEPRWRGLLSKVVLACAAAVAIGAVAVWLWMPDKQQAPAPPPASQVPPPSASQVAPTPVAPPMTPQAAPPPAPAAPQTPAVTATDLSTAFTVRGRTGIAFEACYFIPDDNGYPVSDPESPNALGLVGLSQQWADITSKLNRLGINIEANTAGVVTGITFRDDQSRRAWANWWAVAKCSI